MACDRPEALRRQAWASSAITFAAAWLAVALFVPPALIAESGGGNPVLRVTGGEIQGMLIPGGGAAFKGVPYAQPPVGDLRWRDPVAVKPWTGVRDARNFAPPCIQEKSKIYPEADQGNKEDCLYLNVWTPEWPSKAPKAVMVWLYGGSNSSGTASSPVFDGTALSRRDVVVVTLNFRLGVFGFFAHPGLTAESPHHSSGNYGFLDQIAALQWVHDNIASFGGDPNRVTLFGQSSGAMSTAFLVASPLAKGLIQRGIQESGPPVREFETLAEAEQQGIQFAQSLHAPADPAAAIKFLRSLPGDSIQKATESAHPNAGESASITEIDGYVINKYVALAYEDGEDAPIPMILGSNAREQVHSYEPAVMKKWIEGNFGSLAPEAEKFYGWANGAAGKDDPFFGPSGVQITADTRQRCPVIAQGIWRSSHNHATYEYMFDPPIAGEPATRHMAEVPFVFGNLLPNGSLGGPFTTADRKISEQIQTYWVNFAKTGDPNAKGLPSWPKFNATSRPYLEFTLHDGPVVHESLRRDICDLYIEALKETIPANTAAAYPK